MEVNSYSHAPYKGGGLEISPSPQGYNPEDPVLRKRGAQPGNLNALKHGFYSRRLSELETEVGLEKEITMVRVLLQYVSELAADPTLDLEILLKALNTISSATSRLSRLLRAQKELDEASVDSGTGLLQVLEEAAKGLGIE